MTDIDRIYKEDMEYLKENYSKEIQEYEKIGNKKNFNEIINREHYLEGKKYSLDLWFEYDIVDFESLETAYKAMKEVKGIIDEVIGG